MRIICKRVGDSIHDRSPNVDTIQISKTNEKKKIHIYMSEFMKTVSSLKQNFFACLPAIAGREASPVLEKPGGLPSRRIGGDSLVVWLPGDTKQGGAALPPGGWGGSQKRAFSSVKRPIFVAGELWPGIDLPVESPNTSRPDTRKVGE